jgi:hydrogenase large subunit
MLSKHIAYSKEFVPIFDDLCDFLVKIGYDEIGVRKANLVSYGVYARVLDFRITEEIEFEWKPREGIGTGLLEAMRGALGHWTVLRNGKIYRYQVITPSSWNESPRDHLGQPEPYEEAIIDTPITEALSPEEWEGIDIVRIIRSMDSLSWLWYSPLCRQ